MKKRRLAGAISTTLLIVLMISGCATDPQDAELKKMLGGAGYSSGWMDVEFALRGKGSSARHTIVMVAEGTPASKSSDPFEIPGIPARDPKAAGINELQRVYLDAATGRLAFVGTYKAAYATGALDYAALLNDAMHSPAPFLSLEPTPASKAATLNFADDLDRAARISRTGSATPHPPPVSLSARNISGAIQHQRPGVPSLAKT
ncbi:MAG: hypothetical protein P8X90_12675 [Desulfobacterales bacterium]